MGKRGVRMGVRWDRLLILMGVALILLVIVSVLAIR
jgi:hypothetical protein